MAAEVHMNTLISVTQLPVIEEQLHSMKDAVQERVRECTSLAVSEDNVKDVKAVRAQLRRDFAGLEEQRKSVRRAVLEPLNRFEAVYRECVSDPIKEADSVLAGRITDVESTIKSRCEDELRNYFAECAASMDVPWLTYEQAVKQAGIRVDMASARAKTPKKLMDGIYAFCEKVSEEQAAIRSMPDGDAVMAEYRQCLNLARAAETVRIRREAEQRIRKETQKAEEQAESRIPPVEILAAPEPVMTMAFRVKGTLAGLKRLKEYMQAEGLEFEAV